MRNNDNDNRNNDKDTVQYNIKNIYNVNNIVDEHL